MAETSSPVALYDEAASLQALQRYGILDTPMEPAYDDLAGIAAHVCEAPVALISLLDSHRQWFKASVGLPLRETPLDQSVCRYAIRQPDVFIVPDLAQDVRFAHYGIVTQEHPLRFYAGAPLVTPDGYALGTLCVLDRRPRRDFGADQRHRLQAFAQVVSDALRNRQQRRLAEWERALHTLGPTATLLWLMDGPTPRLAHRSDNLPHIVGVETARLLAAGAPLNALCHPADADVVRAVMEKDIELTSERHVIAIKVFRSLGDLGPAMGMIGTLVGLVAMLANMSDPKSIGPAMAVALLTTLYGAIEANMVAIPIADKLELRSGEEQLSRTLILDAIMGIQDGQNPRVIQAMLQNYLNQSKRNNGLD